MSVIKTSPPAIAVILACVAGSCFGQFVMAQKNANGLYAAVENAVWTIKPSADSKAHQEPGWFRDVLCGIWAYLVVGWTKVKSLIAKAELLEKSIFKITLLGGPEKIKRMQTADVLVIKARQDSPSTSPLLPKKQLKD